MRLEVAPGLGAQREVRRLVAHRRAGIDRGAHDGGTDVLYDLSIELVVPIPGFVKRRAEVRILNTLKELKVRAEEPA